MSNTSKLTELLRALPQEAQQSIYENHLAELFDLIPKEKSAKVLSAATRLQEKHKNAPKLDLRGKRKQISWLFDELSRDAKVSFVKERSNREELLSEALNTLVDWLGDIWSVVYEHNIGYGNAHMCLLFVADALAQLSETSSLGGCKCAVINLPVEVSLRDKHGKIVKHHSVIGPQSIDGVLLWIWRDLFVSLFSKGLKSEKDKIPEMLEDIESVLGVDGLERLLHGGKRNSSDDEDSDEDDDDDYGCENDDDDEDQLSTIDADSDYDTDDIDRCPCRLHASYWPERINRERLSLRESVEKRLLTIFETMPSLRLYNTIISIGHNSIHTRDIDEILDEKIMEIAGDTPDTLVAALEIQISNYDSTNVAVLLEEHSYLLRPRDTATLQSAVKLLLDTDDHDQGFAILENELNDSVRAIHMAVRSTFSHIEEEPNKKYLADLLRLKWGSPARKVRVEEWVDRVITDSNLTVNPVALAALMMGMPMLPGTEEGDDADILNFVNLDQGDPDLDDLREEYRPNLKARFDGWVQVAKVRSAGHKLLEGLYQRSVEKMPWLRATDTITEMANKLNERPNKQHIVDALRNLSSFAKLQRKKLRPEPAKRTADKSQEATSPSGPSGRGGASSSAFTPIPTPIAASTTASTPTAPPPHTGPLPFQTHATFPFTFGPMAYGPVPPPPYYHVPGGMEDVD